MANGYSHIEIKNTADTMNYIVALRIAKKLFAAQPSLIS